MNPDNRNFLDAARALGRHSYQLAISPVYRSGMDWCYFLALALGLAIISLLAWRSWSAKARRLRVERPSLFRSLHAPYWAPLSLLLISFGSAGYAPLLFHGLQVEGEKWTPRPWGPPCTAPISGIYLTIGLAVMAFLAGILWMLRRQFRETWYDGEHGSAYWASWSELRIGKDWRWVIPALVHYRGTVKPWSGGAGHTVIALGRQAIRRMMSLEGSTGSGKGFTVISGIIASIKEPFILQDIKSECQGIDGLRTLTGLEPIRFGCAAQGGWPSMRFNFLHEARTDEHPLDACASLAATLCPKQGNQNDFIMALGQDVFTFLFVHSDIQTLGDLSDLVQQHGLIPLVEGYGAPAGLMGRLSAKNMDGWTTDTIQSALSPFASGWGREVTSAHDFTLEDFLRRGGYLLSAEPIESRRAPIRAMWGMLLRKMLTSNRPLNLTLILDEFLAAGRIPNLSDALVTLRSKEVSIIAAFQHRAGVLAVYGPQEGKAILDSFVNRVILLNGLNPDSARELSAELGQRTVLERRQAGQRSRRQVARPLLEVADIERRAKSKEFWAVVQGDGLTIGGAPVVAKLTGSAGAGLVRHPSADEVSAAKAASASIPQPSPYCPPGRQVAPQSFSTAIPRIDSSDKKEDEVIPDFDVDPPSPPNELDL